jgi:DNA invertase Pin-like site-specific DNA recombinase
MPKGTRAALYLRVSTDGQTTDNQRRTLTEVSERRGWTVTTIYEDAGISGGKGRDKRPGFDAMLKDATRRRFDVLMFWSIDRLGRSTAAVTTALAELDAAGVSIYADKEAMDATTPHGRAMLQMAAVFAELERGMIRERVMAGLARVRAEGKKQLGRPKVGKKIEDADTRPAVGWRRDVEGVQGPRRGSVDRHAGAAGDAPGASGSALTGQL